MSFKNDGIQVQEYVWDFDVDGGAAGAFDLSAKAGYAPLPVGAIVTGVTACVVTAVTSGGSLTAEWGNGDDSDGYSGTAIAKATLVANYVENGWTNGSALLWDDTNDVQKYLYIDDATTGKFQFTVNVAAATAGKIVFMVSYYFPNH